MKLQINQQEVFIMEYITLNNKVKMPMAGIGVFMMSPAEAESSVESALKRAAPAGGLIYHHQAVGV